MSSTNKEQEPFRESSEVALLRRFEKQRVTYAEAAYALNRPRWWVQQECSRLQISLANSRIPRDWTYANLLRLFELIENGTPIARIAEMLKVPPRKLHRIISANKVLGLRSATLIQIKTLLANGENDIQISQRLKCKASTIAKVRKKFGYSPSHDDDTTDGPVHGPARPSTSSKVIDSQKEQSAA